MTYLLGIQEANRVAFASWLEFLVNTMHWFSHFVQTNLYDSGILT